MTFADTGGIMTFKAFRDMACAADWRRPGGGHTSASAELRRLLDLKLFDAELYKGQGHETAKRCMGCHYNVARSLVRSGKRAKASSSSIPRPQFRIGRRCTIWSWLRPGIRPRQACARAFGREAGAPPQAAFGGVSVSARLAAFN